MGESKRYLNTLYELRKDFSERLGIYLDSKFSPYHFLRGINPFGTRNVKMIKPKSKELLIYRIFNEEVPAIKLEFLLKLNGDREVYKLKIFYNYQDKVGLFLPRYCRHSCPTSNFFNNLIACEHLYTILAKIDELASSTPKLPFTESTFIPKHREIFHELEKLERGKFPPTEILKKSFELLEEYLHARELISLSDLNLRLRYIKINE